MNPWAPPGHRRVPSVVPAVVWLGEKEAGAAAPFIATGRSGQTITYLSFQELVEIIRDGRPVRSSESWGFDNGGGSGEGEPPKTLETRHSRVGGQDGARVLMLASSPFNLRGRGSRRRSRGARAAARGPTARRGRSGRSASPLRQRRQRM